MATRLRGTIIGRQAYGLDREAPMVNLAVGGQFGYMGADVGAYVPNANYVRRNLFAKVIAPPRAFQYLPNPQYWYGALKAMFELHARTIEGMQATLTVEMGETQAGGAGEVQQDVTNVTRQRSTPTLGLDEKYGLAWNTFLEGWITWLLMDPDTKAPRIISDPQFRAMSGGLTDPMDWLPDMTGATVLFVEPDPLYRRAVQAWLSTNMMPMGGGERQGRKDMTSANELVNYTIEFSAFTQQGRGVMQFAQSVLDEMNLTYANPNLRPAFTDTISANIKAAENGLTEKIDEASRTAVF